MENVDAVRRLYEAMDERDTETIRSLAHPDLEWIPDERVGERPVRGVEDVIRFFSERAEMFGEVSTDVERISAADDRVLAFIRVHGSGGRSGARFDIRIAHVWTFRDGLVTRGEGYGDRDAALSAIGGS